MWECPDPTAKGKSQSSWVVVIFLIEFFKHILFIYFLRFYILILRMSVHTGAGAADGHKRAPDPQEPEFARWL